MPSTIPQAERTPAGRRLRCLARFAVVLLSLPIHVAAAQPATASSGGPTNVMPRDGNALRADESMLGGLDASQPANASADVSYMRGWVIATRDNQALPFVVIDKVSAQVFVFDATGRPIGSTPALLGMEVGDGSVGDVGRTALSAIGKSQRTTPAGRFPASLSLDLHGQEILWVDYDTALALHRVVKGTAAERRAQRLQSPTSSDNRISFGCINVPASFFDRHIATTFSTSGGIVYIIPEMTKVDEMFRLPAPSQSVAGSDP